MVYLKYWTPNLMPLMVYPKVLLPPNFINLDVTIDSLHQSFVDLQQTVGAARSLCHVQATLSKARLSIKSADSFPHPYLVLHCSGAVQA